MKLFFSLPLLSRQGLNQSANGEAGDHHVQTAAFTLVETLVSMAILAMIMVAISAATSAVSRTCKRTSNNITSFQRARTGFEALTQTLSQATLATYWDYIDSIGNPRTSTNTATFIPAAYNRTSDLHFVSGWASNLVPGASTNPGNTQGHAIFFQSSLGCSTSSAYGILSSSLNAVGFYVQFSDDKADWPGFVANHFTPAKGNYRFRLMQWVQQTQNLHVYDSTCQAGYNAGWFSTYLPAVVGGPCTELHTLAENVTLLVILPKLAPDAETQMSGGGAPQFPGTLLCPSYQYDSRSWKSGYELTAGGANLLSQSNIGSYQLRDLMRNQLPPMVDVVMVVVSENDVRRLQQKYSGSQDTAPVELLVPQGNNANGNPYFQKSADLAADIQAYETQLTSSHIAFKTFWSTVPINEAKWSPN